VVSSLSSKSSLHRTITIIHYTFCARPAEAYPLGSIADNAGLCRLLDLSSEQLRDVVHARARRRFNRGLKRKPMGLIKKLRKAKSEAKPNEKPEPVKTHLRDMIIVPEMIGSIVSCYSGKAFNQIEIKPEMVGMYLGVGIPSVR